MPKGISIGTFSDNGNLDYDLGGAAADRFGLLLTGDFGTGALSVFGGDGTNFAALQILDPYDGNHTALSMTVAGLYFYKALCLELRFTLGGATNPALDVVLFLAPRGNHEG